MFKKTFLVFILFCEICNAQYWGGRKNYWNTNNLYWNSGSWNWNNPYWQWSPVPSYNPYLYNNYDYRYTYPNINFIYINPSINYLTPQNNFKDDLNFRRP